MREGVHPRGTLADTVSESHDGHAHAGHTHGVSADADRAKLWTAFALIVGFMAVEVAAGILASSLALISDAAHMLTDAVAIALSIAAIRLAARPPHGRWTYGFKRAEILSAQINGAVLLALALLLLYEGIRRLFEPPDVRGGIVVAVALVGIVVNLAAVKVLAAANRQSLNVEGSFQHILTDLYAFIGTAIAGAVILLTGFDQADAIASMAVAGLMLWSSWGLLSASAGVMLEGAPAGLHPDEIGHALAATRGVIEVHDLHVWEVTSGFPALSAHVLVADGADCHGTREALAAMLHDQYGIDHSTLQVEHARGGLLAIEAAGPPAAQAGPPPAGQP
jgi:cobalt-zinc-cadmium efflux system protein